jgi:hypothetical protein
LTTGAERPEQRQRFRELCQRLGVKCVLIELSAGHSPSQPMTACYHHGAIGAVLDEVASQCRALREAGFPLVRLKLEAVASAQGVPEGDDEAARLPRANYFEMHVKLSLPASMNLDPLRVLCERHGARLSRNAFKSEADGRSERFVTLRVYRAGRRTALDRLEALERDLIGAGFSVVHRQREYTIFDSAEILDAGWLDRPAPEVAS